MHHLKIGSPVPLSYARYAGLALFAAACLTEYALTLMILLGQAHFVLAYLYQYRAGKINTLYLVRLLFFVSLIFLVSYFSGGFNLISYIAMAYFVLHFLYDERYMYKEGYDLQGWLRLMPIMIMQFIYILAIIVSDFKLIDARWLGALISVVALALYIFIKRFSGAPAYASDNYLLAVYATCLYMFFSRPAEILESMRSAYVLLVLLHNWNWYLRYWDRFSTQPELLKKFSIDITLVNLGVFSLFALLLLFPGNLGTALNKTFFTLEAFYVWALLHFFVTFRQQDLKNWMPSIFAQRLHR